MNRLTAFPALVALLLGPLALLLGPLGCGASLPRRLVIEESVEGWRYERYQRVLDVEFPLEGNRAVGHTALYVRRERGQQRHLVSAFVTVYARGRGLAADIAARVRGLEGYRVRVGEVDGENVWLLTGTDGDRWALWVSGLRLVKVGAPEGPELPEDVVEAYLDLYPSDLDERGRAEASAPSAGPASHDTRPSQSGDGPPVPSDPVTPVPSGEGRGEGR